MSTLARDLPRLIAAQISIHAGMTGLRMATPLLALSQGHSPAAVGVLLALFALTQVFLALPAGSYTVQVQATTGRSTRPLVVAR